MVGEEEGLKGSGDTSVRSEADSEVTEISSTLTKYAGIFEEIERKKNGV